jgi:ferredoxin
MAESRELQVSSELKHELLSELTDEAVAKGAGAPPATPPPKRPMRVVIDESKCIAAGQCVLAAPNVFDQRDSDGIVVLLDPEPPESERAAVEDAIIRCPTGVISLEAD